MSRIVRLATTALLYEYPMQSGVMVERGLAAVDEAAGWNPDLIVLTEEIDILGLNDEERRMMGEPVPGGPTLELFSKKAREHGTNIIVGIRERDGDRRYNAGVVIDREGGFVGKYRKTHLAPGEHEEGVEPGDEYPVFDLDFGKVGITLCMEIHYPEIWTMLALQGADVIAHPTWAADYTGDMSESLINARAMDNQVYVMTSHPASSPYLVGRALGHSRIVDPYGRTRATTSHRPGVAVAEVDLDQVYEYWAEGDLKRHYPTLKDCFLGMRRPETYGILMRPDAENSWKLASPTLACPAVVDEGSE